MNENAAPVPPKLVQPAGRRPFLRLRTYFLTGIIVAGPIGITMYLVWLIVTFIDDRITPLIPERYNPEFYLPFNIPGLGLVIVLVGLTMVGFVSVHLLGRTFFRLGESLVNRMPIVRSIYGALKQIFETVLAQSSTSFREVVLVEYPRHGLWALAFVTSVTKGEVQRLTEVDVVNIFLPTTPNPTSGFLLFVPRAAVIHLDMSVEEGIKMVISGGLVTPEDRAAGVQALSRPVATAPESGDIQDGNHQRGSAG